MRTSTVHPGRINPPATPDQGSQTDRVSPAPLDVRGIEISPAVRRLLDQSNQAPTQQSGHGIVDDAKSKPLAQQAAEAAVRLGAGDLKDLAGAMGIPADAFVDAGGSAIKVVVGNKKDRAQLISKAMSDRSLLSARLVREPNKGLNYGGIPVRIDVGRLSDRTPTPAINNPFGITTHGADAKEPLAKQFATATAQRGARELKLLAGDLGITAKAEAQAGDDSRIRITVGTAADRVELMNQSLKSDLAFSAPVKQMPDGTHTYAGVPIDIVVR